jgi:hypothetical protein
VCSVKYELWTASHSAVEQVSRNPGFKPPCCTAPVNSSLLVCIRLENFSNFGREVSVRVRVLDAQPAALFLIKGDYKSELAKMQWLASGTEGAGVIELSNIFLKLLANGPVTLEVCFSFKQIFDGAWREDPDATKVIVVTGL